MGSPGEPTGNHHHPAELGQDQESGFLSHGDVPPVPALVHQRIPVSDVLVGSLGMGMRWRETPLSPVCRARSALAQP